MKQLFKLLTLGLLFVSFTNTLVSQTKQINFSDRVLGRFSAQVLQIPQEKLYLQTDKPYYSAGEDLWFKSYLVNAIDHTPTAISKFIYVELIDKCDSVFQRVKIRQDSLGFAGKLKLPPELPFGYYTLRAYSYWMRNAGADFFFKKNIYIGNPIDDAVSGSISYSKPKDGVVVATVKLRDADKNPIVDRQIVGALDWTGKRKTKVSGITRIDGTVSFPIQVTNTTLRNKSLEVSFADKKSKYHQKFMLPSFAEDFDVQFFPEGGTLLANCMQTIAFKAIGSNGLSVDVTGNIVDSLGEEFSQFESNYKGMGKIMLQARPDQVYDVNVKTSGGLEKRFRIGPASINGILLQLKQHHGRIFYEVINKTGIDDQAFYLLIHSRGRVVAVKQLDSLSMSGQISESLIPEGIVSFSVINQLTGQTLSERLSFVLHPEAYSIRMSSDKPAYNRREEVNLNFDLAGKDSIPIEGDFSLSVTDSHSVIQDSLADNIRTNLLLTSDLKGYIEDPGAYFLDSGNGTREHLDLLMLTQGWKRFSTADVLSGEAMQPQYYLEVGQTLSGKVFNLFNKPSKNADIFMISAANMPSSRFVKTDSTGRYLIEGISFPDSTLIVLKAKKQKNFGDVELIPDPDDFAQELTFIPYTEKSAGTELTDYLTQSKEKYYVEGGMPVVNLKEVTVTAQMKKTSGDYYYSGTADTEIGLEKLDKMPGMNVLNILMGVPGVQVNGVSISIRGSSGAPMILIDNMETEDATELTYLTSNDVENISVFKGSSAALFGSRGGNGVIAISLRKGVNAQRSRQISLACIYPLGYQKPSQFYVPKYEVDSVYRDGKPDLRTTVYWNPSLTSDRPGHITARFPTADRDNDYTVTLEGISKDGEICRFTGHIRRKNKQ